jgi:hypothetical protein
MQSGNRLTVPNMWDGPCHTHEHPAFNQQPRKPDGPDLQLTHVAKLLEVYFYNQVEYEALDRVLRAAEFYRMALENFHERPEMAYTLLLSALEAIIDLKTYTDDDKYDPALQEQLAQIAAQCKDGRKSLLLSRAGCIKSADGSRNWWTPTFLTPTSNSARPARISPRSSPARI